MSELSFGPIEILLLVRKPMRIPTIFLHNVQHPVENTIGYFKSSIPQGTQNKNLIHYSPGVVLSALRSF